MGRFLSMYVRSSRQRLADCKRLTEEDFHDVVAV